MVNIDISIVNWNNRICKQKYIIIMNISITKIWTLVLEAWIMKWKEFLWKP